MCVGCRCDSARAYFSLCSTDQNSLVQTVNRTGHKSKWLCCLRNIDKCRTNIRNSNDVILVVPQNTRVIFGSLNGGALNSNGKAHGIKISGNDN